MMRPAAIFAAGLSILLAGGSARADDAPTAEPKFESEIAPILQQHCHKCHGIEKPKSDLDLTRVATMLQGGESGPALVPHQADQSLLVEMIADGSMPPEGEEKLTAAQIELIRRWIGAGAASSAAPSETRSKIDPTAREFWAFRKLSPPSVPALAQGDRARTPVDAFILARLQEQGLCFSPQADRLTLLRRASYDLLGLPPTPEEIDVFFADQRADTYERLIDRLLSSPHFGERWGRHWLDAAGYSDITGGDNDATIIKLSDGKWKYRDYVVRAFNQDKPYGRFLIEQLAGDELVDWRNAKSFTPEIEELLVATGFLRNAGDDTDEKELLTPDILHGILQRTSEVVANNVLGLTLGCAKCHDHKYEPIPQQDYYRLLAAFTPVYNPISWVQPKNRSLADIAPVEKASAQEHNARLDREIGEIQKQQAEIKQPVRERLFETKLAGLPDPIRADVKTAIQTAADKRSEVQKYLADKFKATLGVDDAALNAALDASQKQQLAEADRRIGALNSTRRTWGTIQAAYDVGPPPETHLLRRGNYETPGPAVEPGFLNILCSSPADGSSPVAPAAVLQPAGPTSGRRLALALWITDWDAPSGGLAARVMVNRVWQHLFGHGIVETSENLGISGARPTHPELLEWLASHFVAEGQQLKPLVKLLVTSAVYRQASGRTSPADSVATGAATNADPGGHLLSHMPLRRLEAELVRDAILAVSGQLDPTLGGPSLPLEVQPSGMVVIQDKGLPTPAAKYRRSLYVLARRNYHLSMLNVFDQPTMSTNCPHRQQSAVVLQSLAMLNDAMVLSAAERFAQRVRASAGEGVAARQIELAFRIALGRGPSIEEAGWSQELLSQHAAEYAEAKLSTDQVAEKALTHLCHMLLNSNEFLYVP
jgi:mono/diheme cytochrome c family protein